MALRLIETVLPATDGDDIRELLAEQFLLEHRHVRLANDEILVRILLHAEQCEAVLDLLEARCASDADHRVVVLPVEATLPRVDPEQEQEQEQGPDAGAGPAPPPDDTPGRIGREELYEDIKDAARWSRVHLAMVVLSTIVAVIGLYQNSVTTLIGAMVIAPHLGPNVSLALATTLGDLPLARRALVTNLAGLATTALLSAMFGAAVYVNPTLSEVASRTWVGPGDITLALASGCAGALAFTTGVSTTLIGVMVAVALLPPLVTFGMLLGGGHAALATGALSLFLVNLICVNLAGVTTFLVQGIRPATWWEKGRAKKATRIAISLWVTSLAALVAAILLLRYR